MSSPFSALPSSSPSAPATSWTKLPTAVLNNTFVPYPATTSPGGSGFGEGAYGSGAYGGGTVTTSSRVTNWTAVTTK